MLLDILSHWLVGSAAAVMASHFGRWDARKNGLAGKQAAINDVMFALTWPILLTSIAIAIFKSLVSRPRARS